MARLWFCSRLVLLAACAASAQIRQVDSSLLYDISLLSLVVRRHGADVRTNLLACASCDACI